MPDTKLMPARPRATRLAAAALTAVFALGAGACSSGKSQSAPTTTSTVAVAAGATTATDSYRGATIVVAGHGEATGRPNTMTMSIGVRSDAASAQQALDQNNQESTNLQSTLKAKGVAARDMQTSNLSISPDYDKYGHITGYNVNDTLTVTVHGIATAGNVIDAAAAAVGNDITFDGIQLSIADTSTLLKDARENAVSQAVGHARQLAHAAGMKLGTVRNIDDTNVVSPLPETFATADLAAGAVRAPIQAGSQQLSVDVSVTFALMN